MDTIAVGCGLAYLAHSPTFRQLAILPARSAYVLTIGLILAVAISERMAQRVPEYQLLLHPFIVASIYALAIWLWTQHSQTLLGLCLNSKPAMVIGVLSYSLYLWQQPFLSPYSQAWFTQSPMNLIGVAVLAVLSYLLVERPLLQVKERRCCSTA